MNIYKVKNEYLSVLEKLNSDDELSIEIIKDTLAPYENEANEASLIAGANIKNLESLKEAMKKYKEEMDIKIKKVEKKIEDYKKYVIEFMNTRNIQSIPGVEFSISLKNSPPAVDDYDVSLIPEEYKKTTITVSTNKIAIREAIKSGVHVPGARLVTSQSLTIK